jgi:hypothetical protein
MFGLLIEEIEKRFPNKHFNKKEAEIYKRCFTIENGKILDMIYNLSISQRESVMFGVLLEYANDKKIMPDKYIQDLLVLRDRRRKTEFGVFSFINYKEMEYPFLLRLIGHLALLIFFYLLSTVDYHLKFFFYPIMLIYAVYYFLREYFHFKR